MIFMTVCCDARYFQRDAARHNCYPMQTTEVIDVPFNRCERPSRFDRAAMRGDGLVLIRVADTSTAT